MKMLFRAILLSIVAIYLGFMASFIVSILKGLEDLDDLPGSFYEFDYF